MHAPTSEDIVKPDFSTPFDAPYIPSFPFSYRNAEILTLAYRTDRKLAARLLPEPLKLDGDTVLIHIYKMNDTDWLGKYTECNVMIPARLPSGQIAAYSPYLLLSSDVGVAQGREVHGQPKKQARVKLKSVTDAWVGQVFRNGIEVICGTMAYKQTRCAPEDVLGCFDFRTSVNLKAINHIDGKPAIRQLTARDLTNVVIHESWSGPCSVELRKNVQAPVFRLPVVEEVTGFYWRADFDLVGGSVVHDYLLTDS